MDLNFLSSGTPEAPRDSFNAAYSSLEQTIRNFSKEKLMYEQTIDALNNQIILTKDHLERLNSEQQMQTADYQKVFDVLEENESVRQEVEASILMAEHKLEILQTTMEGFDKVEHDLFNQYEAHEEFLYCLKFRQVQLLRWIEETKLKNETLEANLQKVEEELEKRINEVNEATAQAEKLASEHMQEKMDLLKEMENAKTTAEERINRLTENMEEIEKLLGEAKKKNEEQRNIFLEESAAMKSQNQEITAALESKLLRMQGEKLTISGELDDSKKQLDETNDSLNRQRLQFEGEVAALNTKIQDITATFEAKQEELNAEKLALSEGLEECKKLLEKSKESMENQTSRLESEKTSLNLKLQETTAALELEVSKLQIEKSLLSAELDCAKKQHEADEDIMNRQRVQFEEEGAAFKKQIQEDATSHQLKLSQLEDAKLAVSEQLENAMKLLETTKCSMQEQRSHLEGEKAALKRDLEESHGNIEKQASEFTNEKMALLETLNQAETAFKDLTIKASEEKSQSLQQLEQLKSEFESKESSLNEEKQTLEDELQQQSSTFEKEKADLISSHNDEIDNLNHEFQKCRVELRNMYQKYQDQKMAIGKLVEETGVRPVTLPQAKKDSSRLKDKSPSMKADYPSKQDSFEISANLKSPLVSLPIRQRNIGSSTPNRSNGGQSRPSILKRPNQETEKNKNVSFGPTQVSDFIISSSSDTDSVSPETAAANAKLHSTHKRQKLMDEKNDAMKENKKSEKDQEEFETWLDVKVPEPVTKPRRYIRRIGPQKSFM